jgi:hypothetical protein
MPNSTDSRLIIRSGNAAARNPERIEHLAREDGVSIKVLGKVCPYCGKAGAVLCETTQRIIYECPNAHQYEKRKHLETHSEEPH